jgi:hypothetical protein
MIKNISVFISAFSICLNVSAQVVWGESNTRTEFRNNAGLQGNSGAISGFFQTYNPTNFPTGANSWWHLLDVRHSNPANNYTMQFAGSFFDQNLFFRKTNDNAAQPWSRVLLETGGKTGIGTLTPTEALDVVGNIKANNFYMPGGSVINARGRLHISGDELLYILNLNGVVIGKEWGGNGNLSVQGTTVMGNVSTPAGYKLYVEQGILTEKVKVAIKNSGNWADHVFTADYKLQPLDKVETFIKNNNHLPGVPSAQQLVNDGGVDVSSMLAKQMEKIEELTLYIIEMNKKIEKLEKENNAFKDK